MAASEVGEGARCRCECVREKEPDESLFSR